MTVKAIMQDKRFKNHKNIHQVLHSMNFGPSVVDTRLQSDHGCIIFDNISDCVHEGNSFVQLGGDCVEVGHPILVFDRLAASVLTIRRCQFVAATSCARTSSNQRHCVFMRTRGVPTNRYSGALHATRLRNHASPQPPLLGAKVLRAKTIPTNSLPRS